jgi:GT2 family glycosyltransferase
MKKNYIILVNWNGWGDTIECLESIFRHVPSDTRIIICDNGSEDYSVERIQGWAEGSLNVHVPVNNSLRYLSWPPVAKPVSYRIYNCHDAEHGGEAADESCMVLICNGGNLGFAGGNNVGLRYVLARGDAEYIWLLNNDTVISPDALESLVRRMTERPDAGMCGSTLLHYESPERVQARGGGWYCKWIGLPWHMGRFGRIHDTVDATRVENRINYIVGASLFVSRLFLEQVGLMCDDYFLFFEETDWAIRSKGKYSLAYAPESIVYHKIGASIGTDSDPRMKSYLCDYYNIRNRIYFTRKFYSYALPSIYVVLIMAVLMRALLGQWARVKMIAQLMLQCPRSVPVKPPSI